MRRPQSDTSPVDHNGIPQLAKPVPRELQAGMWRRLIQSGHDQDADLPDILDMLGITEARP